MSKPRLLGTGILLLLCITVSRAEITVAIDRNSDDQSFHFKSVPLPANNDAATAAEFVLLDGEVDSNSGGLAVLHDGRVPKEEDQPGQNFFFRAGSDGGRLRIDLGSVMAVSRVCTYSWHPGSRAPQVYRLYAASGRGANFQLAPARGTDPVQCGWESVAKVDTRPGHEDGRGQVGVCISNSAAGELGKFRYLLLDLFRTEERDSFGNTFFSEIDVIDAQGPAPTSDPALERIPIAKSFEADHGHYHFTIDATAAPDLMDWADAKLRPVVQEWYPKLVRLLPSDGFEPSTNIVLRFRTDMGGTPAAAGGARISLNSGWFRGELNREALGSVVHEMVHVVQSYGRARQVNPSATRTPGWVVEGMADYIRWFLYEPEAKGAEITERNVARAKYNSSYRITGNFLDWVTRKYDPELVRKLNAAARQGQYRDELWQSATGKSLPDLGEEWKQANEARLKSQQKN